MAKIILTNGVLNVEETYEQILNTPRKGDWLELVEDNKELKYIDKALGKNYNYKVFININHIQIIKP